MKRLGLVLATLACWMLICGCNTVFDPSFMGQSSGNEWLNEYSYCEEQSSVPLYERFNIVALYEDYFIAHDETFTYVLILTSPPDEARLNTFVATTYDRFANEVEGLKIDRFVIERIIFDGIIIFR